MCHLFTIELTLDRVKVKSWQIPPCAMINMSCINLCMFMCLGLSAKLDQCVRMCYECACTCMPISVLTHLAHCCCHRFVKHVPRWRAPVCRLSVWRWRHRGLSRKLGSEVWKRRKRAWDPSIHPCIQPHSPSKPQTRSRERAGRGRSWRRRR